jgi:hypothetical protein
MKKIYLIFSMLAVFFGTQAQVAVTITNPTNATPALAASYVSLSAAITDLNLATTISGPIILTCASSGAETSPVGGYVVNFAAATTTTNNVVINGSSSTITAPTPQSSGVLTDAIFKIIGSDNVTISNFTMLENALNTTTAAATNNMTEFGVALFYATTTNGAQNITVLNNTITLNRTYQNTWGVYSNSTHGALAVTTTTSATTTAGANSGLKIYGNTISNVNQGILVLGATAAPDYNTGLDIGGTGGAQANSITNWGTTGTFSGYVNISGTLNCILVRNTNNYNISYNTLTSSLGGNTVSTQRAIFVPAFSVIPTGTYTNTINNNNISVKSGIIAGVINGILVEASTTTATSTLNINNNDFNNFGHTTATGTGTITFISHAVGASILSTNINSNTFTNMSVNTTASVIFIVRAGSSLSGSNENVNSNSIVTGFTKTGVGGTVTCFSANASSVNGATMTNNLNNFSNINILGSTAFVGWSNTDGASSSSGSTKTITNNTISNISSTATPTGQLTGMSVNFSGPNTVVSNNTITNFSGGGVILGMSYGSNNGQGTHTVSNNTVTSLTSSGGAINGIQGGSTSIVILNVNGNTINTLSTTGASQINGLILSAGTLNNAFKNNIRNLQSNNLSGTVNGIAVSAGTTTNIYNNFISDLRTPSSTAANPLNGISAGGGTNVNLYYNTIVLGRAATIVSTGTQFGATGISFGSTVNTTLRNNIVWIDATPIGTGTVAAVRRSAAGIAGTAPSAINYNSNNNILYVLTATGTSPVVANINKYLYLEGSVTTTATNGYGIEIGQADNPTLNLKNDPNFNTACGLFKSFMGVRDGGSFTENNLTASGAPGHTFVPAGSTYADNSGQVITTPAITDDYSSIARAALPDMGALEFSGTAIDATPPAILFTALANLVCTTAPTLNAVITDASSVNTTAGLAPRLYYRKGGAAAEADVFLNYPTENTSAFNGWKYVEATGVAPNFSFAINYSLLTSAMNIGDSLTYFVVAQDNAAVPNVGKNAVVFPITFCPTSVNIPSLGAVPTSSSLGYKITPYTPTYTNGIAGNYPPGTLNAQMVYINLSGSTACPDNVNSVTFNTGTSTAPSTDILQAKCYYTTTSVFATTTPYGASLSAPVSGPLTFTATQPLANGTGNYFWLVYDVNCAAVALDSINATVTNIVIGSNTFIPTGTPYSKHAIAAAGDNITGAPTAILGLAAVNPYTTLGKTLEVGEPSPILNSQGGGNSGVANYSWGTAASSTAWYKLVVPTTGYGSSGNFGIWLDTTSGNSSADNQVAIWDFPSMPSSCGTVANFTGGKLIQANDDRIVTGDFIATSELPGAGVISAVRARLTPGNTYYIQIDGFGTNTPYGNLFVEDLSQAPHNITNNGLGSFHNPTAVDMRFAAYEVNGTDGWTYYYDNNATSTTLTDDKVLMAVNWSSNPNFYYGGTYLPGTEMSNHLKRSAQSTTAPSTGNALISIDSIVVWSGRNNAAAASNDLALTDGGYVLSAKWWMMNKFWNLIPKNQPSAPVGVRTFYSDADFTALQTTVVAGGGMLAAHADMKFIKATKGAGAHYSNAEVDPGAGHAALTAGTVTNLTWANFDGVEAGINQAEFTVSSFSGGGGGSTGLPNSPLPSADVLYGRKQGSTNLLDWKVSCTTSPSVDITLERSVDNRNFAPIQTQNATAARCDQNFTYVDASPVVGINYYRVKLVTDQGRVRYTPIVALLSATKGFELISLAPNPVKDIATLSISSAKAGRIEMNVLDFAGKMLSKESITVISGNNPITMNFASLAAGTYTIVARNAEGELKTTRFVKY